jgi:hypothetical protein
MAGALANLGLAVSRERLCPFHLLNRFTGMAKINRF